MAFQEVMIAPTGAASFEEAMRMASEVYQSLKKILSESDSQGNGLLSRISPGHRY